MSFDSDFTIDLDTGAIRHTSGTTVYSVLELHQWAQDKADDPSGVDNDTPTEIAGKRDATKPTVLTLPNSGPEATVFNIDDDAAQYLNFGSIEQRGGDDLYTGLKSLGSPLVPNSPLYVVQDNLKLTKFWGGGHIQVLIKVKANNALIDNGDVTVFSRKFGQSYSTFDVNLAAGSEQPAAITTSIDTAITKSKQDALTTFGFVNITVADVTKDLNNGNGAKLYKGTINCNGARLSDVYQALMVATEEDSTQLINNIPGWRYRKLSPAYNENTSAPFGNFQGGTFFVAQGWWLDNVDTQDAQNYQLTADDGTIQTPPALTGVTVTNLVAGDYVFVARSATPGGAVDKAQYTLASGNNSGDSVLTINEIPDADTPQAGTIRIGNDRYEYTSHNASVFTLATALTKNYSAATAAYIPLIDIQATSNQTAVSVLYSTDRTLTGYVRRSQSPDPITSFPIAATMTSAPVAINTVRRLEV